jgi:hypothetical protein
MGNTAGLNDANTYDVVMGVLYAITAIVLLVTAYIIYTKQFRRQKMEAVQTVNFITAQYNIYKTKTQLLVEVPVMMEVVVRLLDADEKSVIDLLNGELSKGEHIIEFDPTNYENGNYFLKLESPTTQILKKITISN